jgi:hypothetical protein
VWAQPNTAPSCLARETWAGLPDAFGRGEERDHLGTPEFRTRQITRVTTRLDAAVFRIAELAERSRRRWQADTSLAPRKTSRAMEVWPGQTPPGGLKALTVSVVARFVRTD